MFKNLACIVLFFSLTHCRVEKDSTEAPAINYGKEDYEEMRLVLLSDSSYLRKLKDKVSAGDSMALKMQLVLNSPYDTLLKYRIFNEEEMMLLIHSFKISAETIAKFKTTQKELDSLNQDSVLRHYRLLVDSLHTQGRR